jgi:hypothetical protein
VPRHEASARFGMGSRLDTPKRVAGKLNEEINAVLARAEMEQRLVERCGAPLIQTPGPLGGTAESTGLKKVAGYGGLMVAGSGRRSCMLCFCDERSVHGQDHGGLNHRQAFDRHDGCSRGRDWHDCDRRARCRL